MKRSKALRSADEKVDKSHRYPISEAISLMKTCSTVKFDPTAEVHFTLGINPKHADQQIRSNVSLPHGTGKTVRVAVFCSDEKVSEAKSAGADEVGDSEMVEKVLRGWTDFDVVVATPDMMKHLAKAARILGPKGLMPSPKAGTVTQDVGKVVKELKAGRIEIRNDKNGIVHTIFGKLSFDEKALAENLEKMIQTIKEVRPSGQKGEYIKNITINSTMGVGIKIEIPDSK